MKFNLKHLVVVASLGLLLGVGPRVAAQESQYFPPGPTKRTSSSNDAAGASLNRTANASTLVAQPVGGTDTTLSNGWAAFQFTATSPTLGSVAIQLKGSGTFTAGTIKAYIYSDSSGKPSASVSDESTGQPITIDARGITTSYSTYEFRLPQNDLDDEFAEGCTQPGCGPLTVGTKYWVVLHMDSLAGATLSLNTSNATANDTYATASDSSGSPGTWTTADNVTPVYTLYGDAGSGVYAYSQNRNALWGRSNTGIAVRGYSVFDYGGKFDSVYAIGGGGVSQYSYGWRGSSVRSIGLVGVSAATFGGQMSGVTGGLQSTCSGASCNAEQIVPSGSGSNAIQVLDGTNSFALAFQMDHAGNAVTLGYWQTFPTTVSALPSCSSTLQGARMYVTDATSTTFHATVVGGGSTPIMVVCDGTNWKIGG